MFNSIAVSCLNMDEMTPPNSTETTETGRVPQLRQWITSHSPLSASWDYGDVFAGTYALLFAVNMVGIAAAPPTTGGNVGQSLCNTAITRTVNSVAPLALAVVVVGGLMLTYLLHAYAGFKKDPNKVKEIKDWRNRAGITAVSAPLLGKLLEIIIGFTGLGLAPCIDIIPAL
jgi:hypothetical protein